MVKALITGGTGFIGAQIARLLIDKGHTARILRRSTSRLTALEGLSVEHAIGDVTNADSLRSAMVGCEWVFHVAAVADYWRADRQQMIHVNVDGTALVLEAAEQAGVARVVFTSSGAAIGPRSDGQPADESTPFGLAADQWPYGYSKVLAEQVVQKAVARGLPVMIVNPAVVIGPGDVNQISGSLIIALAKYPIPAIPGGSITLIDVRDVAAAHIAAAEHGTPGDRYLLGAYNVSWPDFARTTAQVIGTHAPGLIIPAGLLKAAAGLINGVNHLDVHLPIDATQISLSSRPILFDAHKAWAAFGTPQITLEQSIRDTYEWYIAHGVIKRKGQG